MAQLIKIRTSNHPNGIYLKAEDIKVITSALDEHYRLPKEIREHKKAPEDTQLCIHYKEWGKKIFPKDHGSYILKQFDNEVVLGVGE